MWLSPLGLPRSDSHAVLPSSSAWHEEPTSDDLLCYAARYPDLAAAFGDDTESLLRHYRHFGHLEGRNAFCESDRIAVFLNVASNASNATLDELAACSQHAASAAERSGMQADTFVSSDPDAPAWMVQSLGALVPSSTSSSAGDLLERLREARRDQPGQWRLILNLYGHHGSSHDYECLCSTVWHVLAIFGQLPRQVPSAGAKTQEAPQVRPRAAVDMLAAQGALEHWGGRPWAHRSFWSTGAFPSVRLVGQMPPAPKPIALYFPQYYTFEENDRFWGEGFTEWTLLKPFTPGRGELPIRKPKPTSEGGLGYYNLLDRGTRSRQAELAKAYGVHGFCYYHYWFSGPTAPANHSVRHPTLRSWPGPRTQLPSPTLNR